MLGLSFSSQLDRSSYVVSNVKSDSRKIQSWFILWSFCLLKLFFSWSTKRPYMEYSCHVWTRALICYLDVLDKLQKLVYRTVSSSITASLELLALRRNLWIYDHLNWLSCFHFLTLMGCLLVFLIGCMIFCHEFEMDVFVNCFFSRTGRPTLEFFCL